MEYVLVLGGCTLDKTYYQNKNFSFPKKPNILKTGGKGANQAISASKAGANVVMLTRLSAKKGEKATTKLILQNLKDNKINVDNVELDPDIYNDFSSIYLSSNGDIDLKRMTSAIDSFDDDLIEKYRQLILNAKIVVSQFKAPKSFLHSLIDFCYQNNKTIVLTPTRPDHLKIYDKENVDLLNKVTYITANEIECKRIFEGYSIEDAVKKYPNKLIVTLGENGLIYHNGNDIVRLPAFNLGQVVDTAGAGETFVGNFVAGLFNGYTFEQSLIRANVASAMKIQHHSAQNGIPTKKEVDSQINKLIAENAYPQINFSSSIGK